MHGEQAVSETFQMFLLTLDKNPDQLKPSEANVGQFLDFYLEQHEGAVPSEPDLEDDPESEGKKPSLSLTAMRRMQIQHNRNCMNIKLHSTAAPL